MLKPWSGSAALRSSVRYPSGYLHISMRLIKGKLSEETNLDAVLEAVKLY